MKNNYSRFVVIALITIILFLFVMTVRGYAAEGEIYFQTTISGKVVDKEGLPIPGVAVNIKNSNKGTVTNLDGVYTIEAAPNAVLVFSFLGFKKQEVPVQGRSEINVTMDENVTALAEVEINAGYYNTTRRESTGNISRVTAEEIEMQPVVSPLEALQGRMAGVEVVPGGDQPGMAPTIRIRGRNSLREEGNYPLYIIDGVPINSTPMSSYSILGTAGIDPLNYLNLSNIASIEVLKDADATAIYGSRGANGVILITSKKGKSGKTQLQARVYSGFSDVPSRVELLDTEEYLKIRNLAFVNDETEPNENNAYDLLVWDQHRYTDWQDLFFGKNSPITNVDLSLTGGNESDSFRLGGSYHKQGTVFLGEHSYNKITAGLQWSHQSDNQKLNTDFFVNFGLDSNDLVGDFDLSHSAFRLPPNAPKLFNEDGSLHWEEWNKGGIDNPLEGFFNRSLTQGTNLNSNLVVSYQLLKGIDLKSSFGYTYYHGDEIVKRPQRSYNPADWNNYRNRSRELFTDRRSWIVEPQIIFGQNIGKSRISALVGSTFQQSNSREQGVQGEGYVAESLIGNLDAAEKVTALSYLNSTYRYNSIFARLGLDWNKKYFLNFTGRRDGSSRFGPGKRFANFWAIGGAWIFAQEPQLNSSSFLTFGKIRGSYGTTGNDHIGDYGYFDAYEATDGPGGLYPNQLANPDYSWEVNKKLEAGLELGFIKDRIKFGLSWYRNRSSNQLVGFALPATTGFSTVQANLSATVENKGWEVELSALNVQKGDFNWETFLNITIPENKLVDYPGIEQSPYSSTYRIGHPLNISLLYEYSGLDPETGYYTVRDIDEDGRISMEDRVEVWDRMREFYGGWGNNLTWNKFSLKFLFQFVKQEGTISMFEAGAINNQRIEVVEAMEENSRFQKISNTIEANRAYSNVLNSTFAVVDASYIKLKNLSFSYSLPNILLQNVGLESGKVFLTGQNLFTVTDYKGIDPERPYGGTSLGNLRTLTAGIEFIF